MQKRVSYSSRLSSSHKQYKYSDHVNFKGGGGIKAP
jgi:hypothetical protein